MTIVKTMLFAALIAWSAVAAIHGAEVVVLPPTCAGWLSASLSASEQLRIRRYFCNFSVWHQQRRRIRTVACRREGSQGLCGRWRMD